MSYSNLKAVRDSFDDEDVSDDVEDEVFIRDGRNGTTRVDEDRGVKRPLMAPRRTKKSNPLITEVNSSKSPNCRIFCAPCCYGFIALSTLIGSIIMVVLLILWLPNSLNKISFWNLGRSVISEAELIPCTEFSVDDVWTKTLPKLTIESSVRLNDVNHDADDQTVLPVVCTVYFGRDPPCLGGVLALDGRTGDTIWQHWTPHSVYSLDCSGDLTGDSVNDCLASGKGGLLHAVNGHDGSMLWKYRPGATGKMFDVYAGQLIRDVDGDGVLDVLAAHTEGAVSGGGLAGQLVLVSGSNGRLLRQLATPRGEETYYAPQVLLRSDSQDLVLFGTGGQASAGGLYALSLQQLIMGDVSRLQTIYHDDTKGVMSSPVLADVNSDGYDDIIVATFNSDVLAFDGLTFQRLWNFSTPTSETFSSPTPTYFNGDDVPDFLVKYQTGPGFPVYYYSQATVLDGRTGTPVQKPLVDSLASQSAGVSVSMEGLGNDFLLYWSAYCVGHEDAVDSFSFAPDISLLAQSRADTCKLRFNSTQSYKLWALNEHIPPPGYPIYTSDSRQALEYNNSMSALLEAQQYMKTHPDFQDYYRRQQTNPDPKPEKLIVSKQQPAADIHENRPIFRHKEDQPVLIGNNDNNNHHHSASNRDRPEYRGEGEQVLTGYTNDDRYLNVRKHGDTPAGHRNNPQWRHRQRQQWQANEEPATYQELNDNANVAEKMFENQGPNRESDYDSQYEPRIDGYTRQRDERSKTRGGRRGGLDEAPYRDDYVRQHDERSKTRVNARENMANDEMLYGHRNVEDISRMKDGKKRFGASENLVKRENKEWHMPISVDSYARQGDDRSKIMGGFRKHTVKRESVVEQKEVKPRGTQRLSSTGTLAPSLLGGNDNIDVIFATYWLPTAVDPPAPDPYRECIQNKLKLAEQNTGKFLGMDANSVEAAIAAECVDVAKSPPNSDNTDKKASFDPLNISLGQMTVYRLRVTCRCSNIARSERCSTVLPFDKQSWPAFMGWNGKGYFKSRQDNV